MPFYGLEKINFQHNSSLADGVITICQNALDYAKSTRTLTKSGELPIFNEDRLTVMGKYLRETFRVQLSRLIEHELNIPVAAIFIDDKTLAFLQAYVLYEFKDRPVQSLIDNESLYTGALSSDKIDLYKQQPYLSLSGKVDLKIGKLKEKPNNYSLKFMFFASSFLTEEFVKNIPPVTARELAAVILHEIGHGLGAYEHCADLFYRSEIISDTIKTTSLSDPDKVTVPKHDILSPEEVSALGSDFKELSDSVKEEKRSVTFPTRVAILIGLYAAFFFILPILLSFFSIFSVQSEINTMANKGNIGNSKTSDITVTALNVSLIERLADEFVSRHGLGKDLLSMFNKLELYTVDGAHRTYTNEVITRLNGMTTLLQFFKIISICSLGGFVMASSAIWEDHFKRMNQILENNMTIFKDNTLEPELRDKYIKDTKEMIFILDMYQKNKVNKFKQLFWGTIRNIISKHGPINAITTANLNRDYEILQRLTKGLVRNKLYFHAARIKSKMD